MSALIRLGHPVVIVITIQDVRGRNDFWISRNKQNCILTGGKFSNLKLLDRNVVMGRSI